MVTNAKCLFCGSAYHVPPRRMNATRYCSLTCRWEAPRAFRQKRTVQERFWSRVNTHGPLPVHCPELGPCHIWTGGIASTGYGRLWIDGKFQQAQRIGWELENGPMPAHLYALHHCDNPPCVRASHIYLGTAQDNSDDKMRRGRFVRVSQIGEHNGHAVLTAAAVTIIRDAYRHGGVTQQALAIAYGVSRSTIRDVVTSKRWREGSL